MTTQTSTTLPKVSIVTTVWNLYKNGRDGYFRQMMETVHNQTYPNIEHILVNNNSDDGTSDLIQEYVDKGYVAKACFEKQQGLWYGMNRGLAEASGEFINFMNSDDYFCRNDAVELSIHAILKSGADWSYGRSHKVSLDTKDILFKWYFDDYATIYDGRCPNHQTLFVRTSLLREQGGFEINPAFRAGTFSDDLSMMRLVFAGHIPAVIPEVLVTFRSGGASENTGRSNVEQYTRYIKEEFGGYELSAKECDALFGEAGIRSLDKTSFIDLVNKIKIPAWRNRLIKLYKRKVSLPKIKKIHCSNPSPRISIIVPVYNAQETIRRAIYSLLNQTYENIEILCINDGSVDHSLDILQELQKMDTRVKLFTQANQGPGAARNIGLRHARGKFIMFMDADDTYQPQMCSVMLHSIIKQDVDLVMCNTNMIERDYGNIPFPFEEGKFDINLHIRKYTNVWLWNKIFKKSIIESNALSFSVGSKTDDMLFVRSYLTISKNIYFLNQKLVNYYRTKNSIVEAYNSESPTKEDIIDFVDCLESMVQFLKQYVKKNTLEDKDDIEYARYLFQNNIYTAWRNVGTEFEKEFLDRVATCVSRIGKECVPEESLLQAIQQRDFQVAANLLDYFSYCFSPMLRKKYLFQPNLKPVFNGKAVTVVFAVTDNYCKYLSVALQSIIDHSSADKAYDIIVLEEDVSDIHKTTLQNQIPANFSLRFYNVRSIVEKYNLKSWFYTGRLAPVTYFRLLIAEILSDYSKCIYLDTDVIVQHDLYELYQTDLKDFYLGAIRDVILSADSDSVSDFKDCLRMKDPRNNYFNAGVMLLNLEGIRKADLLTQFLMLEKIHSHYYRNLQNGHLAREAHDQNILNGVCEGHVTYLSPTWNMITSSYFYKEDGCHPYKGEYAHFAENLKAALSGDIKIIHYATYIKPWQNPYLPWAHIWWNVARKTPFYEEILYQNISALSPHNTDSKQLLKQLANRHKILRQYYRCKILSKITCGNKRKHYKQKRDKLHEQVRKIRTFLK